MPWFCMLGGRRLNGYWTLVDLYWRGIPEVLRESPVLMSVCLPHIPRGLACVQTQTFALRGRQLATWTVVLLNIGSGLVINLHVYSRKTCIRDTSKKMELIAFWILRITLDVIQRALNLYCLGLCKCNNGVVQEIVRTNSSYFENNNIWFSE